jgi:hypothetical protein
MKGYKISEWRKRMVLGVRRRVKRRTIRREKRKERRKERRVARKERK